MRSVAAPTPAGSNCGGVTNGTVGTNSNRVVLFQKGLRGVLRRGLLRDRWRKGEPLGWLFGTPGAHLAGRLGGTCTWVATKVWRQRQRKAPG